MLQSAGSPLGVLPPAQEGGFQDTRVARLYEGTDEILILKIAAAVLGKDYEAFQ